jgi:hypothetical protein
MNLFIAGFRGTYWPTAPPNLGLEDNRPDVHDEAEFDIPNTQAALERFMSNISKLADDEYQSLSDLLDSLPDPSSYTTAKTMTAIEQGKRQFGASNEAVSFQLAQVLCGPDCVPVSLVIYIDGSFIKHGIPVKSIYG